MDSEILWINEGFVMDEAGNMIMTSYVDVRPPGSRTAIWTLVKGCRREHALEDTEAILVSPLERFREEGENLIRDEQEGLAAENTETVKAETPGEAFQRRQVTDMNEAVELLDSGMRITHRKTSRTVERSGKHVSYGKEWWIFSTALMPETEEEWAAWRASLDPAYDYESVIGRPAMFAQALGRMVTEQLGPQGKDANLRESFGDEPPVQSRHPSQLILHGPVVYADRLYDKLIRDVDKTKRLMAAIFVKSATHAAQREYRFAIFRNGTVDETAFLTVSGMMRDALQPSKTGLVRPAPKAAEATANERAGAATGAVDSRRPLYKRATVTERATQREETRSESRGPDGQILSSESELRESVREKTLTRDLDGEEQVDDVIHVMAQEVEDGVQRGRNQELLPDGTAPESAASDEETVKEIAFEERASSDTGGGEGDGISVVHGAGRAYKTLQELFEQRLNDPAFPMGGMSETWAEEALSQDEVLRMYRMVATLAYKVTLVAVENQEAASSACWHAVQCIRNIYARLGDIVDTVAIEGERFVVVRLNTSEEFKAEGRIVVSSSGAYAYWFKRTGTEEIGHGHGPLGRMFFPVGDQVEQFESFGWPSKER